MITAAAVRMFLEPRMRAFHRDLANPRAAQERVLRDIVRRVARTKRGRAHGIDGRETYEEFASKLPVVTYDELRPWIERQQLTDEPVRSYQLTSGSTAAAKAIPTTASLKRTFSRMFSLWLHDVLKHGPRFETGRFYFSASEASESDIEYVSGPR